MRLARQYLQYAFLFALLSACSTLGLPTPDTFNERLAAGYVTVTAIRTSATNLLTAKKISPDDAQNVLESTNAARAGLDVTRTIGKTDLNAANARLTAITTALVALQTYLSSRGGK